MMYSREVYDYLANLADPKAQELAKKIGQAYGFLNISNCAEAQARFNELVQAFDACMLIPTAAKKQQQCVELTCKAKEFRVDIKQSANLTEEEKKQYDALMSECVEAAVSNILGIKIQKTKV